MGKAHSDDLRVRVYDEIAGGGSRRAAARRFGVSASTGVRLARRMAETGSLTPGRHGRPPGQGKLAAHRDILIRWVDGQGDVTMPELAARLAAERDVVVHPAWCRGSCGRWGTPSNKTLLASEAVRQDVAEARRTWRSGLQPRMRQEPHCLIFVDETGTTTKNGATARTGEAWRALQGACTLWPLGNSDVRLRPTLRRPERTLDHRPPDEPSDFRDLGRNPDCAYASARRRRDPRQSVQPQERESQSDR